MASRNYEGSRLGRESLRPAANPVDTYVQPKKETSLLSLAEGLSNFAPAVGKVAEQLHENSMKRAAEEGAENISVDVNSGKTPAEAVARINPAASKEYREAAKKQAAQLAAFNYGASLNDYMTAELSDETDLDSFNKKVDEFSADWVKKNTPENDGEFVRYFQRQAAALRANNVSQMAWRVGEKKRLKTEEEFGQLVGAAVNAELTTTKPEGRQDRVNQAVGALRQRAFDMGVRGSRVNELIFENISNVGIADGNPDLVKLLLDVPTGPDGTATLGGIPSYREKIARAYHAAEVTENNNANTKDPIKKAKADAVLAKLNTLLIAAHESGIEPSTVPVTDLLKEMNGIDPTRLDDMFAMRQSFSLGHKRETLPVIEAELYDHLYDPDQRWGQTELLRAKQDGGMSNDTYLKFRKLIESRDRVRVARKGATPEAMMADARRIIGENVDAMGLGADPNAARIVKGSFRRKLRTQMYEWLGTPEGEKSSPQQIRDHARLLAESITADMKAVEEATGSSK